VWDRKRPGESETEREKIRRVWNWKTGNQENMGPKEKRPGESGTGKEETR
jgi:hypothetical protein